MTIDFDRAKELVTRPSESLAVELKRWIDPSTSDGAAKIVRAVLALRNYGGGYLVIGFDDKSLLPDKDNVPKDVQAQFHHDKMQWLVTKFASDPFELGVEFPEREGQIYPVLSVPTGVKTIVAARSDLKDGDENLISAGDVYVRSLRANYTPSTAKASWQDWSDLVETCFDNREADVGRFLRRHLGGVSPELLRGVAQSLDGTSGAPATPDAPLNDLLKSGEARYAAVLAERKLSLPDFGTWEVALILDGDVPRYKANIEFLRLLDASNPEYTGWPVWLDSTGFTAKDARPHVANGAWEALIADLNSAWGGNHVDFVRLDPVGRFYLLRALEDDVEDTPRVPAPFSALDFYLVTIRVAEALAVGLAFGKAMRCDPATTVLEFAFRWRRLKGRALTSWTNPQRYISPRTAYQDEVLSIVQVPLDAPLSALGDFVHLATEPLFEVFDGFALGKSITEDMTRRLIERRL